MDKPDGAIRVLHVSDIHVDVPLRHVPLGGWAGKRLMGGANLVLRRGKHFRRVREKVKVLDRFWREAGVDLVLCTGDYTVLGTEAELAAAREVIAPLTEAPLGFVTVPGNHDVYVPDAVGRFERFFGDLLETDLPDLKTDGDWPIVRLVGDTVAVVAVNSARPRSSIRKAARCSRKTRPAPIRIPGARVVASPIPSSTRCLVSSLIPGWRVGSSS